MKAEEAMAEAIKRLGEVIRERDAFKARLGAEQDLAARLADLLRRTAEALGKAPPFTMPDGLADLPALAGDLKDRVTEHGARGSLDAAVLGSVDPEIERELGLLGRDPAQVIARLAAKVDELRHDLEHAKEDRDILADEVRMLRMPPGAPPEAE